MPEIGEKSELACLDENSERTSDIETIESGNPSAGFFINRYGSHIFLKSGLDYASFT